MLFQLLSSLVQIDSQNFAIRGITKEGGAHQPNECVECDKLVEYTKTIAAYILKVLQ